MADEFKNWSIHILLLAVALLENAYHFFLNIFFDCTPKITKVEFESSFLWKKHIRSNLQNSLFVKRKEVVNEILDLSLQVVNTQEKKIYSLGNTISITKVLTSTDSSPIDLLYFFYSNKKILYI